MQLSENFTLEELTFSSYAVRHNIKNIPKDLTNLTKLAQTLEKIRTLIGNKPIKVTSGYRSPVVNKGVNGSKSSAHKLGLAADIKVLGWTNLELATFLRKHVEELNLDQLILEFPPTGWVHIGLSLTTPRHQILTIRYNKSRKVETLVGIWDNNKRIL